MSPDAYVRVCCTDPLTWWASLGETDQAQWFGAWGSVAAVMGAAAFFVIDKVRERAREAQKNSISAQHQAIAMEPNLRRAIEELREFARKLDAKQTHIMELTEMVHWELGHTEALERTIADATAFEVGTGANLLRFVSLSKEIDRALLCSWGRDRGADGKYAVVWHLHGSGPMFAEAIWLGDELLKEIQRIARGR
jgi:hypothetical protein